MLVNETNWDAVDAFIESLPADLRGRAKSSILTWILPDVPPATVREAIKHARIGIEADHPEIAAPA